MLNNGEIDNGIIVYLYSVEYYAVIKMVVNE